jgi:ribonucleoside-diphosphate reductase alpha chain
LIEQGYDGSFNGDAYGSVMYQNENLSVRVSDEFMTAAARRARNGGPARSRPASRWRRRTPRGCSTKIAEGTWICGDPGLQYDGAIQKWHTCKGTEPIHSTNPCSEYVFLNNTACNLASLNLMKFKREDGTFDIERFKAAVRIYITAQEILVDNASYPTQEIAENSHIFRTLGLGYANLGSLS